MSVVERMPHECPKCGGEVVMLDSPADVCDLVGENARFYTVMCPQCLVGSAPGCRSRGEALESWEDTKTLIRAMENDRRNRG